MPSAPDSALAGLRWSYPRGDRVDPVVPPDALYSGEGFPQLQLSVIMYQEGRRAGSQALVTLDGADPIRRVVREGDKVGNYEILRIERDRVVVGVRTLGAVHREVLLPFGADSADARNKKP